MNNISKEYQKSANSVIEIFDDLKEEIVSQLPAPGCATIDLNALETMQRIEWLLSMAMKSVIK